MTSLMPVSRGRYDMRDIQAFTLQNTCSAPVCRQMYIVIAFEPNYNTAISHIFLQKGRD